MPTRANVQEIDTGATPASSLTLSSYTPAAGSNRVLEVMVAYGRTVSPTATVTFGGVAMTPRGSVFNSGSFAIAVAAFTLNESAWPSTPANIVATLNGSGGIRIVASTITDVDTANPMDATPVTYNPAANANPWSIAITTNTPNALVSAFGSGSSANTLSSVGAGQDQIRLDVDAVEVGTVDILRTLLWEDAVVPTPQTVTMTATWATAIARSAGVALAYKPFPTGPFFTTDPTAQTAVLSNGGTAAFSAAATGTGTVTLTAEIETGVGTGLYTTLANGSGATWTGLTASGSGSAALTLAGTFTATTLSGRRIRIRGVDPNGTQYSAAVVLTIRRGPVLALTEGNLNGSGQLATTATCDVVCGTGQFVRLRGTKDGVTIYGSAVTT